MSDNPPVTAKDPVENWVRRLQAGETESLEPLINHTQAYGWRIAYAILQDRQETEDALQDAYLSVFQNIGQLREPGAFYGWFKSLVVRRCLRLKGRERPLSDVFAEEPTAEPVEVEQQLDVRAAFLKLSLTDRTVLGLREILDLSYDEISSALEVPLSTVKNRLFNARQRLSNFLKGGAR